MVRRLAIFLVIILLSSSFIFYACAQDARRFGLGTGIRGLKMDIKYLQKLGVGIVRMPIQWELVEPNPGQFDWSKTDLIVQAAQARNVEVLFTLRCISSSGRFSRQPASGTKGFTADNRSQIKEKI